MKRRILAVILSVSLMMGLVAVTPANASETEMTEMTETQTESSENIPPAVEGCSECGQTEGHAENCSQYIPPESVGCTECGQVEGHAESCSQYIPPEPVGCTECGQVEGHAESCSQYISPEPVGCTECGQVEGHAESCSQYIPLEPVGCTECGKVDGHEESCSQYEILFEEEVCEECGQTDGHLKSCSKYITLGPDVSGMTAEEIFACWDEYSEEEKQQILEYLAEYEEETCEALLALIDDADTLEEETVSLTIRAMIPDKKTPDQDMVFNVSDSRGASVKVAILARDFKDGSASITLCLPKGTYSVTADNWSWRYEEKQTEEGNDVVSFAYTKNKTKWLDGDGSRNICYVTGSDENNE